MMRLRCERAELAVRWIERSSQLRGRCRVFIQSCVSHKPRVPWGLALVPPPLVSREREISDTVEIRTRRADRHETCLGWSVGSPPPLARAWQPRERGSDSRNESSVCGSLAGSVGSVGCWSEGTGCMKSSEGVPSPAPGSSMPAGGPPAPLRVENRRMTGKLSISSLPTSLRAALASKKPSTVVPEGSTENRLRAPSLSPSFTRSFRMHTAQDESTLSLAAKAMRERGMVIDPRRSRFMPIWDMVMLCAMVFTALFTPFEVVFVGIEDGGRYINPMWVVNRVVDSLFICDMCLIFHLAYQERAERGGHWVFNKGIIARHYLQGLSLIHI